MAPCTGTLQKKTVYSGEFTTADGKRFVVGSDAGEQEVWHFIGTIEAGQTCKLPEAFVNYTTAPGYATVEQIKAMAPRTGTLVQRSPCSSYFTTADGKGFVIGDPGSGEQVSQFIWTLKDSCRYAFPEAFLDYLKENESKKK